MKSIKYFGRCLELQLGCFTSGKNQENIFIIPVWFLRVLFPLPVT